MQRLAMVLAAMALVALPVRDALAFAQTAGTQFYDIDGRTARELKAAMAESGPQGYWAYTTWYVQWSGDCRVSVKIDYIMPHWADRADGDARLQAEWDRMIEHLWEHEKGHAQHGIEAAREIEASHCAGDPHTITDRWANEDNVYDDETNHGVTQGVRLP